MSVTAEICPEIEVLADRHLRKDLPPLGHVDDAELHQPMSGEFVDPLSLKENLALCAWHEGRDGTQCRALSGAVCSDEHDRFASVDADVDPVQRLHLAVLNSYVPKLEHGRALPCLDKPR